MLSRQDRPRINDPDLRFRHNKSSRLLALPKEVKDRIWELVFGGYLYLAWFGSVPGEIYHQIRGEPGAADEHSKLTQMQSDWTKTGPQVIVTCGQSGLLNLSTSSELRLPAYRALSYTCWAILEETATSPYSANRLIFDNLAAVSTWKRMVREPGLQRKYDQAAVVQNIVIEQLTRRVTFRRDLNLSDTFPGLKVLSLIAKGDTVNFQGPKARLEMFEKLARNYLQGKSFELRWFKEDGKMASKICNA